MIAYDYIIVGGGTAGCTLANRLSADPGVRVLLLEAGGEGRHPFVSVPLGVGKLHEHRMFDWGYDTEVEPGMNDRRLMTLRGKALGGSSAINFMVFSRGNPRDYDRWERNGATGWAWRDVLPYFKRVESWQGGETELRGGSGPVSVVYAAFKDPIERAVLDAAAQCGYPLTGDYNSEAVGFGQTQFSIHKGRRHNAYHAYVRPVRKRRNLTIVTHARALRVLIEQGAARGVIYRRANGSVETAYAEREVILSGGSLNSPQVLMLSGIGPADHLRAIGIEPLVDLPVGKNLQDHLKGVLLWKRREPQGPFHRLMRYDRTALAFARAYLFGTGPAAAVPLGIQGYIKTDPSLDVPDLEFMLRVAPIYAGPWFPKLLPAYKDAWGIDPVLLHPESRGSVQLRSADPTDPIRIEYNYLSAPADIAKFREGFRRAREIGHRPELGAYRGEELAPGAHVVSDADIDAHLRATSLTVSHPCGTCRMGSDEKSVVDPSLQVRGISGLRVVDASVFPDLVSAHTNAAVFMVAERAADLITGTSAPLTSIDEGTRSTRMMAENIATTLSNVTATR